MIIIFHKICERVKSDTDLITFHLNYHFNVHVSICQNECSNLLKLCSNKLRKLAQAIVARKPNGSLLPCASLR